MRIVREDLIKSNLCSCITKLEVEFGSEFDIDYFYVIKGERTKITNSSQKIVSNIQIQCRHFSYS